LEWIENHPPRIQAKGPVQWVMWQFSGDWSPVF